MKSEAARYAPLKFFIRLVHKLNQIFFILTLGAWVLANLFLPQVLWNASGNGPAFLLLGLLYSGAALLVIIFNYLLVRALLELGVLLINLEKNTRDTAALLKSQQSIITAQQP